MTNRPRNRSVTYDDVAAEPTVDSDGQRTLTLHFKRSDDNYSTTVTVQMTEAVATEVASIVVKKVYLREDD